MTNVTTKMTTMNTITILVIRTMCKERGISGTKLAALTDMSTSGLSKIFNGKVTISLPSLLQIAGALHVPASEIMKISEVIAVNLTGGKHWTVHGTAVKADTLQEFMCEYFSNGRLTVESTSGRYGLITGFNLEECPVIKALNDFDRGLG